MRSENRTLLLYISLGGLFFWLFSAGYILPGKPLGIQISNPDRLKELTDKKTQGFEWTPEEFSEEELLQYEVRNELRRIYKEKGWDYSNAIWLKNQPELIYTPEELLLYLKLNEKIVGNGRDSLTPAEEEQLYELWDKRKITEKRGQDAAKGIPGND